MDEESQLLIHLKNTLRQIPDKDLELLAKDIIDGREDFKVRYANLVEYSDLFAGAIIDVDLENKSAFPRAVIIEDLGAQKTLGKVYFKPWQRKTIAVTTLAGGFGQIRLKYLVTGETETSRFLREGSVFFIEKPRPKLSR